jgi:hypothetical protein
VPRRSASYLKRYGARCALDGGFLPFSYLSVATSASGQTLLLEDNRERWIKGEGCFKKKNKSFCGGNITMTGQRHALPPLVSWTQQLSHPYHTPKR